MPRLSAVICLLLSGTIALAAPGRIETETLLIVDESSGQISAPRFAELTDQTIRVTRQLFEFWSVEDRSAELGKIHVKFLPPLGGYYGAQFHWVQGPGGRVRVVSVFGTHREPQELAHKLTHAIYPSSDKLVRNMMGIPAEMRFGNRDSFPMCGLHVDDWVLALRDAGAYRPLTELTPENEPWGQTMGPSGMLILTDERLQHISYAEAGSFGAYLLRHYGMARMKRFYKVNQEKRTRPWAEVYGHSLLELEQEWLAALESARSSRTSGVAEAFRLQGLRGAAMCPPRKGP